MSSDYLNDRIERRLEVLKREQDQASKAVKRDCGCRDECLFLKMTEAHQSSIRCHISDKVRPEDRLPKFDPFDRTLCACNQPPFRPPCDYCASGEYTI